MAYRRLLVVVGVITQAPVIRKILSKVVKSGSPSVHAQCHTPSTNFRANASPDRNDHG